MRILRPVAVPAILAVLVAACSSAGASPSPSATEASAPSEAATSSAEVTPSATPDACARENLALVTDGTLTIGTDNPAYPPYFDPDPADPAWELGNPANGKGFESAVAYAIAGELGFGADEVTWVAVKFDNAYAPGPKTFDFDINQVSYTSERAQAVDLSDGYYFLNQSLVAVGGTPIAEATSIADLAGYQFGAQVGTTSYDTIVEVIKPTKEPRVYDSNDAAIEALKNKQIDGLVVDLPTAFFVTAVQVEGGVIVGQFPPTSGDQEYFSLVLAKDSPLTACVNQAIGALLADDRLDAITQEWLADKADAPVLQP
jgi:polar amino acid transport system substrate-binding protein